MTEFTWPDQRYMGRSADPRMQGLVKFSNPNGEIMPSAYTQGSDNAAALGNQMFTGFNSTMFPNMNKRSEVAPPPGMFTTQMNQEDDYGGLFGGIAEYGGKAMDWAGQQGASELFKMGMGIKDQFFDRPKIRDSYLAQGSSMNALRGVQMAAINENIAGAKRNEAARNKRTAAFDHSQRLV